jgi:hypothetical protein
MSASTRTNAPVTAAGKPEPTTRDTTSRRSAGSARDVAAPSTSTATLEAEADRFADALSGSRCPAADVGLTRSGLTGSDSPWVDSLVRSGLQSPGESLPLHMPPALGVPLSAVRLHRGPVAQAAAGLLGAKGFAHGSHVVLGREAGALDTPAAHRTLFHEVAHVGQQTGFSPQAGERVTQFSLETYIAAMNLKPEPDFAKAAEHLNGESVGTIKTILRNLSPFHRAKLHEAARTHPGFCSNVAQLTEADFRKEHPSDTRSSTTECPGKPAAERKAEPAAGQPKASSDGSGAKSNLELYIAAMNRKPEPDFATAAERLNGESPATIAKILKNLSPFHRATLHQAARSWPGMCSNIAKLTEDDYRKEHPADTRSSAVECVTKPAAADAQDVSIPAQPEAGQQTALGEVVGGDYSAVKDEPNYLDNFTNSGNEAWLPNDRILVFQYPNGATLKIALQDLVRVLDVDSELNPPTPVQKKIQEIVDEGERTGDLVLPRIGGGTGPGKIVSIAIEATTFIRDKDSGVIYPKRSKVFQTHLPRITHLVKQIESVRVNQELWEKAAPKLLQIVTNMEWSAPRGFGSLLVSLGRGARNLARSVKGVVKPSAVPKLPVKPPAVDPPTPKVPVKGEAPHATPPKASALDEVTDETKELFGRKPELKQALAKAPRAARALKKCASPCFPEHATQTQIDRLERMLQDAETAGITWNEKRLTDFLRSKQDWKELEDGLDQLERDLTTKRGVFGEFGEAGKQIGGDKVTPQGRPATTALRAQPGKASGGDQLPEVAGNWFSDVRGAAAGTRDIRVTQIPGQLVKKLRAMDFRNFDDFRESFWKLVAGDPVLKQGWSPTNLGRMQQGLAPFTGRSHLGRPEAVGGGSNAVYQLNHKLAIKNSGEVYNLDNIEVVSPRFHGEIGD